MATTTQSRLHAILESHFGVAVPSCGEATANLVSDLGLDSLDIVELMMSIEDEFKIEISDTEAEAFFEQTAPADRKVIADLITLIDQKLAAVTHA